MPASSSRPRRVYGHGESACGHAGGITLEDRINDEVRKILETYAEEMNKTGANYQEMFRKVKSELVKKYKAVL